MTTIIEKRVHFFFVTNSTQLHFLIRNLKLHGPFAVSLPFSKSTSINVAGFCIDHLPLAVRFVAFPLTCVCITVRKGHGAMPRHGSRDEIARVGITWHADLDAQSMGSTIFLSGEGVRAAEIGSKAMTSKVGGIALTMKPSEEIDGVSAFAFCFEFRSSRNFIRHANQSI